MDNVKYNDILSNVSSSFNSNNGSSDNMNIKSIDLNKHSSKSIKYKKSISDNSNNNNLSTMPSKIISNTEPDYLILNKLKEYATIKSKKQISIKSNNTKLSMKNDKDSYINNNNDNKLLLKNKFHIKLIPLVENDNKNSNNNVNNICKENISNMKINGNIVNKYSKNEIVIGFNNNLREDRINKIKNKKKKSISCFGCI